MSDAAPKSPASVKTTDKRKTDTGDTSDAAERLLAREAPEGYLAAWARSLAKPLDLARAAAEQPYLHFRLGEERFALAASHVREVHRPGRVHAIPGRTNDVFLGLVCLRGELQLCASLYALLGVAAPASAPASAAASAADRSRMVVVERGAEVWAFAADEVVDIRRAASDAVMESPTTVAKALIHFTDGVLDFGGDVRAARLSPARLFDGLARRLS